jgi:feruloyl esterase
MFAQRYPDVFDGIAASAPAINWAQLFGGQTYPQQVLNELGEYPHPCEDAALAKAVVDACDRNDGLIDGIISHVDSCTFDPYQLVDTPVECSVSGPAVISKAAATAMDAAWHGTRTANGSLLWPSAGYEADVTTGVLATECFGNGTCESQRTTLFTNFVRYFVQKDPEFNLNNMTREEYVQTFKKGVREYSSILNTDSPGLSEFRAVGGKMLSYHGTYHDHHHHKNLIATLTTLHRPTS